ncbi:MAG: triple tyrosine motif-containing protein [Verrucomicrobiales bacterium]
MFQIDSEGFEKVVPETPDGTKANNLYHVFRDRAGDPAVLTNAGTFVRKDGEWRVERRFKLPRSRSANGCYDEYGKLWILTDSGLSVAARDGELRTIRPLPFQSGMKMLLRDREGSIWIPTKQGLYQFYPSAFTSWEVEPGEVKHKVFGASQDGEGRMWFAGERGLYFLSHGDATIQPHPAWRRGSHDLVGTASGGAYFTDSGSRVHFATINSTVSLGTKSKFLFEADDGSLWTGGKRGLHQRSSAQDEPQEHPLVPPNQEIDIEHMVQDSRGRRFITVRGVGIVQMDGEPEPRLVSAPPDSPEAKRPSSLQADPDDNIWLVSRGPNGLGYWSARHDRWQFAEWSRLTTPFVIPTNASILADREGGFWLATISGLIRCEREELMAAIAEGGRPVEWQSFGRRDGLPTVACSYHRTGPCVDDRGRLWIPTDAGVAMTDPAAWQALKRSIPPPPVVITRIQVDSEAVEEEGAAQVRVPPGGHQLEIVFNALHFASPDRIQYRFRLVGFEDTWIDAGTSNQARYQKIPPGEYQFEVIADNGHDMWQETAAVVAVSVLPQWWETLWFWSGITVLAVLGAGTIVGLRIRAANARNDLLASFSRQLIGSQEEERKRVAGVLHDSLGQELLVIKSRIDLGNTEASALSGSMGNAIQRVKQLSRELRPALLERVGLAAALQAMTNEVSDATGIPIASEIGGIDEIDPYISDETKISIYRLVQECFNNIVAHSDASEARLSVHRDRATIVVKVEDDGRGFDSAEVLKRRVPSLGYRGMKERVSLIGGSFHCQTAPGSGTVIRAVFPVPRHETSPSHHRRRSSSLPPGSAANS